MTIRTLIVDDEPLARSGLRHLLRDHEDIDVVGECSDGGEALERIEMLEPDLVFMDVEMPELGGFDVVEKLAGEAPEIVFVTAYAEYALRAFRVHALDYLLKPIDGDAFAAALDRARARISARQAATGSPHAELERLLREYRESSAGETARRYLPRIFVREGDRGFFVPTSDIEWVQTADNYLRISAGSREYLIRATMQELEQKLDPHQFARIHRRTIINLELVQDITIDFRGNPIVRMKSGSQHRISRTFRERLLGGPL